MEKEKTRKSLTLKRKIELIDEVEKFPVKEKRKKKRKKKKKKSYSRRVPNPSIHGNCRVEQQRKVPG